MIRGNPKYRTEDMPVPASFVSESRRLIAYLVPRETKPGPNGTETTIQHSGLQIYFEEGEVSVVNSLLFEEMVKSNKFNASLHGWRPNPEDPTGFWRAHGLIETRSVQVVDKNTIVLGGLSPEERIKLLDPKMKKVKVPENLPVIRSVRFNA